MSRIIFEGPINNLSLGNVSLNLIRELVKIERLQSYFPVGDSADFSAYDKLDNNIRENIILAGQGRLLSFSRDLPTLRVWHLNNSERKISDNQFLYTFYELDSPTDEEVNIVNQQTHTFFSNSGAAKLFKDKGCQNVSSVPLGFDEDLFKIERRELFDSDVIHFGLIGKLEKRKNTQKIIRAWLKLFGNDPKYQLTCLINNPFFKPEIYNQIIHQTLDGKRWTNINFLPHLKTNSEMNQVYNSIDIDLSGCCGSEGWGLPAFNAACLGKICLVGNAGAHQDWAEGDNIVLIEPEGKEPAEDGIFFGKGPFNQGNIAFFSDEGIVSGIEKTVNLYNSGFVDKERIDLQEKFNYNNTVNQILNTIDNHQEVWTGTN
jgi:glycosyltransferase involved in cell wall biosynthesis